jgi:hypothetical protein
LEHWKLREQDLLSHWCSVANRAHSERESLSRVCLRYGVSKTPEDPAAFVQTA